MVVMDKDEQVAPVAGRIIGAEVCLFDIMDRLSFSLSLSGRRSERSRQRKDTGFKGKICSWRRSEEEEEMEKNSERKRRKTGRGRKKFTS